jgi:hypothetical protein
MIYLQASADKRAVRQLEEIVGLYPSLPVLLFCNPVAEGLVLGAWHAGATDVLFSPLPPQSLDASLQRGTRKLSYKPDRITPVAARLYKRSPTRRYCDDDPGIS